MSRRTQQEGFTLFKQHEQSGLTAAEFCREHHLNAKYFSKRNSHSEGQNTAIALQQHH